MTSTLTFWNGTDGATGSEFMIERDGYKVLIDCGLVQGIGDNDEERNAHPFEYSPRDVDMLLVTHAHMDHIGRIGKFVAEGFEGKIVSTEPTKALAEVMMNDAIKVMSMKEREDNIPPLYLSKDVLKALSLWEVCEYNKTFDVIPGLRATYKDAGHILGSAMIELRSNKGAILFTGDLGNTPHDILCDTAHPGAVDYIVTESVYGDRSHEERSERREEFADIIRDTLKRNGTLLVPVFSLERSQDILYDLNELIEGGAIPKIPVFLDSPLAIDITRVYERFTDYFNERTRKDIASGDNIFEFPGLLETYTVNDSKEINVVDGAKIILAGSGMSHGGRIQHHELRYLDDPRTTILFVGYQMPGSIGRRIIDGAKKVSIKGRDVKVRAHVEHIFSYSAHKDSPHIQEFIASAEGLKKVFVVLGEPSSRLFLSQRLKEYYGIKADLPNNSETVTLEI